MKDGGVEVKKRSEGKGHIMKTAEFLSLLTDTTEK
jgi:hypothetical protein